MSNLALFRRQTLLAVLYSAVAALAINFKHPDSAIALLWGASALLIAALSRTSPQRWWAPVLACLLPGALFTAASDAWFLFLLMFINAGEAVAAAFLLRRSGVRDLESLASHRWLKAFLKAVCLAPLLMGPLVGLALWATEAGSVLDVAHYVAGHALGNLIFTPVALIMSGQRARQQTMAKLQRNRGTALFIFLMSAAVSLLTFGQDNFSILFMSSLVAVGATVRLGREGAAVSIATIALIGAFLTGLGKGPVYLMPLSRSGQWLMFQFFLAVMVLTVLPVAAELERRRALLRRVRDSEKQFRILAEYSTDAIMRLTESGAISYVSPSIFDLTGFLPAELIGRGGAVLLDQRDRERVAAERHRAITIDGEAHSYSFRVRRKDGEVRWFETHARAITDGDGGRELLAILRDITDSREREQELSQAALTDRLTGLPNRRALEAAVGRLASGDHCIALLDIDRFKDVNDTYGHDAGDAVLAAFAEISRRLVRACDTVARLGGEEFVILFEHTSIEQAYEVCDRMRETLGRTLLATPSGPLRVTVSGGVAQISRGELEESLKAADEALYRAKRSGRDRLALAA